MQVSIETTNGLERKLTIDVPADQIDDASLQKMKELAKTQRINGFRPGKVPLNEIKKRYGQHVRHEVASEVMQRSFYQAVMQEKLRPAGAPHIEPITMDEGKDLQFTATFEVQPEIELQDFGQITLEKITAEVSDDDLSNMITKLCEQQGEWVEVKRKAKDGDQLNIDFVGFVDGEEFAGGKAEGFDLQLGSGQMIPGFEEQLKDAKAGDDVELNVTFPEDYQSKELAGKDALFKTKVNKVSKKEPLNMTQLAEKLGTEDSDIAKMKGDIRANMERELAQTVNAKMKEQVMEKLSNLHEFDLPKAMVDQEINQLKQQMMQQFGGQGANVSDLPSELFEERATGRVKLGLIMSEIISQKEVKTDNEQVKAKLEELAAPYDNPQEVINYYLSDEQRLNEIESLVLEESAIKLVEDAATVTDKPMSFDELMNAEKAAQ
jgi:trigger factor